MPSCNDGPGAERLLENTTPEPPATHVTALEKAIEAGRASPGLLNAAGYWLMEAGCFARADDCLRRSMAIDPDRGETLLLTALNQLEWDPATHHLARAILERLRRIDSGRPALWWGLGRAALAAGEYDTALSHFDRALNRRPDWADPWVGKSDALWRLGRERDAADAADRALRAAPRGHRTLIQRAKLAYRNGDPATAERWYQRAADLYPWKEDTRGRLGTLLLARGEYERGRVEYDRMKYSSPTILRRPELNRPLWDGRALQRERLLVFAEQGNGDAIQLARYLPLVAQRASRIALSCHAPLLPLFARLAVPLELHDRRAPLPDHDCWTPMLSLPKLFRTATDNIPGRRPYLSAAPEDVARWKGRLGDGFKVGLVWAASPFGDHQRNIGLRRLLPLRDIPAARLFSLQVGAAADEVAESGFGRALTELAPHIGDFHDTAAIVSALDLVITVDTAVAHLAGALGRPVWVMLSALSGWCWPPDRESSPWYPSAKLFWQPRLHEWGPVVERLAAELRCAAESHTCS